MNSQTRLLADYLRNRRREIGLSQAELAQSFGYGSAQFVSNWERGISHPPLKRLKQLSEVLQLRLEDLFDIYIRDILDRTRQELEEEFRTCFNLSTSTQSGNS